MAERGSIIVVDDDPTILTVVEAMFLFLDYRCVTAMDGPSALEAISKAPFDIMLTDVAMPGMKGFELTREAKRLRPDMAVIIMTGFIDDFSYDMAIEAGASDFIKKPFTIKELKVRIEHVKMQEELRAMSITDDLTGLYNRRGFFAMAEQLMKQAKRQKMGLFMLYADLDGLKTINDTWGHQEGDIALIETANILKATYRESDVIARISGDEFVVIPIGTDGDNVEAITARLHDRLEEHNAQRNHRYELTLSFGISYYDPEKPCSIDELLAHGDEMMFKQKKLKQKPYPS